MWRRNSSAQLAAFQAERDRGSRLAVGAPYHRRVAVPSPMSSVASSIARRSRPTTWPTRFIARAVHVSVTSCTVPPK